jgi:chemotaxis protein methyltransferase CheR
MVNMQVISITDREFEKIRALVYDKFGISLGEQKKTLVIERLQKILRRENLENFTEYYDYVTKEPSGRALQVMCDLISTHHTHFFRENDHFEYMKKEVLPFLVKNAEKTGKIRIWSAGCSSGEEPYTIGMTIMEYFNHDLGGIDCAILATDVSVSTLEKAVEAQYTEEQISHVPPELKRRYMEETDEGFFSVKDPVRSMVTFKKLNLMDEFYPFKGKFGLILCRNVMIYFDKPTRNVLVEKFSRHTAQEGYLFVGHSEALERSLGYYKYVKPAVYRKA